MPQTTWNKATVPAGTDPYNEVPDTKKAIESAGLVFRVADNAERLGLAALAPGGVLPVPTQVFQSDVGAYWTWDGANWFRHARTTSAAAVTDGFWTITGGLVKTVTDGLTQVTATLRLVRTTAAITIATTDSALIVGLIPAGFRPSPNHYWVASVNTDTGARYAEPQLVINNGGSLVGRSTSGGGILIGVGYTMFISTTWTQ